MKNIRCHFCAEEIPAPTPIIAGRFANICAPCLGLSLGILGDRMAKGSLTMVEPTVAVVEPDVAAGEKP